MCRPPGRASLPAHTNNKMDTAHESEQTSWPVRCSGGFHCQHRGPRRTDLHQRPHRRHQRRLLPGRRGPVAGLQHRHRRLEDFGTGDQGFGGKPQPAADRPRRTGLRAGRLGGRCLGRGRGGRFQGAAEASARHRRHLPQLHPDRRQRGLRHQDPGRPQGQAHLRGRAEVRDRAERSGDLQGCRADLRGHGQGRVPAFRRVG
ncbi:hypothetical protein D3C80_1155990 [compost metagenome]